MTTRLSIYNDALLLLGERQIVALTDDIEARYLLDQVWDSGGVNKCLEMGQWFFAMRAIKCSYDPAISPPWGYRRAFNRPTDWILTSAICSDEYMRVPLTRYVDEQNNIYADVDDIYWRYVSNDTSYGTNYAKWPGSFEEFVCAYFAARICSKLTEDSGLIKQTYGIEKMRLRTAKNRAAMAEPTSFPAQGVWSSARSRGGSRRDRGTRSGDLY